MEGQRKARAWFPVQPFPFSAANPAQWGDLDPRAFTLGTLPSSSSLPTPPPSPPPAFLEGGELLGFGILVEAEGDGI